MTSLALHDTSSHPLSERACFALIVTASGMLWGLAYEVIAQLM